jgi:Protein of unknown function (DUF3011)
MIIRPSVIASTFMVASLSLGTFFSLATPASARETITCESQNNQRNSCSINTRGRVRLIRQLSDASCRGNWGYSRNRIWVRNGCRAQFLVADRGDGRYNRRDGRYYRRDRRYNRYNRRDDRYYRRDGRYDRRDDRYYRIDDRYDRRDDRYYRIDDRYDRRDDRYYRIDDRYDR